MAEEASYPRQRLFLQRIHNTQNLRPDAESFFSSHDRNSAREILISRALVHGRRLFRVTVCPVSDIVSRSSSWLAWSFCLSEVMLSLTNDAVSRKLIPSCRENTSLPKSICSVGNFAPVSHIFRNSKPSTGSTSVLRCRKE